MSHPYVDNACAHAQHDACTGFCPYCGAGCVCGCHAAGQPARVPAREPLRAAHEAVQ